MELKRALSGVDPRSGIAGPFESWANSSSASQLASQSIDCRVYRAVLAEQLYELLLGVGPILNLRIEGIEQHDRYIRGRLAGSI